MTDRTPAAVFPPLDYVTDEIEASGWTWDGLAHWCRTTVSDLQTRLEAGAIDDVLAYRLASAFGTSAHLWRNLAETYRLTMRPEWLPLPGDVPRGETGIFRQGI